jgi:catechol 2,3-dioxygenase-like lactoylglutathione lyase family enzyme
VLAYLHLQEHDMKLASIRLVTNQLEALVSFYGQLCGLEATRLAPEFAEFRLAGAVLAISSEGLTRQFNVGAATAAANRSAILEFEFEAEDVDAVRAGWRGPAPELVMASTVMPWGNRSMLLRDPDGNLVNVFSRPAQGDQSRDVR